MNEQPIVSIITVTYNEVDNIKKTIESVLKQTYTNIKYIIIDGGSTDGTIEIIGQYSDRISFWVTEPDQGIYDAMNKGWAVANQSSYILYLGAGDEIVGMPDMLDPNQDIVYFGDAILGNNIEFKAYANFRLKFGNSLHHQSLLIPKKLNPKPPFNIRYKVYADFDFNQKLMKRKVKFVKSQKLKSVVMPNGFSQHYKTAEWFYIIKSNFGLFYAFVGYLYHHYQQLKMRTSHTNKTFYE